MISTSRGNKTVKQEIKEKEESCRSCISTFHFILLGGRSLSPSLRRKKQQKNCLPCITLFHSPPSPVPVVILPAGFKAFEFLDEERLQNLGTLVEGRVAGVVVAAVVEDFGHVGYKLSQLDVLALL